MKLDPFYLIVDSAAWIERLVPLGVKLVQLRIKDRDEPMLQMEIRRAIDVCTAHGCQLIINDYWRLAIEEWLRLRPSRSRGSSCGRSAGD